MEKIVLKAQNEEELKNMISRSLTLKSDETYRVKVLKYPKKILFVQLKGEYEVEIIKKYETESRKISETEFEKVEKPKVKIEAKIPKSEKRENKKVENDVNSQRFTNRRNYKNEKSEIFRKDEKNDTNIDKIRGFFKEFIVSTKLDIRIINIRKENNNRYLVILDGKDMRFLIGEKGNSLNSFEYLLSTTRKFKNIKVVVDSNNYKQKREHSLRELARKKGRAVLATGNIIRLNPMSARERKIIHEEISFMKGLKSESVGEEPKRYLVIKKIDEKF